MLAQDSPLMQRAQNQGAQYAASRGLLSSSIAGQAMQGAMIDRAQPFALQDASTYTNVYDKNLAAQNQFGLQGNDQVWRGGQNALDRSLTQSESALERANRLALQNDAQSWTSGENVLAREQESAVQQKAIDAESALVAQKAAAEIERLGYSFNLEQKNVSNSFMATTAQNTLAAINGFLGNPDLKPEAREAAIQNAIKMGNEQLAFASTLYGTPVPSLTAPGGKQVGITPQPIGYNNRPVVESDIKTIYANDLGKTTVDAEGMAYWAAQATKNNWTASQLRSNILVAAAGAGGA